MHAFSVMLATEDDEDDVSNVQMRELRNKKAKVWKHPSIYLAVCLYVCPSASHTHLCIQEDWSRRLSAEVSVVPSAPRHVAFDLSNMPVIEVMTQLYWCIKRFE
jgi:hypothetical protein